jgi:hypothetical protein
VKYNNITSHSNVWKEGSTVFNHFKQAGDYLFLPAAGYRTLNNGQLNKRGEMGIYLEQQCVYYHRWLVLEL